MLSCYETLWFRFVGRDASIRLGMLPRDIYWIVKSYEAVSKLNSLKQPRCFFGVSFDINRECLCLFQDSGDKCVRLCTLA